VVDGGGAAIAERRRSALDAVRLYLDQPSGPLAVFFEADVSRGPDHRMGGERDVVRLVEYWRLRWVRVLVILVLAAVAVAVLRAYRLPGPPSISASPQTALLDQPVTVSVRGLPAEANTTVTATAMDADGTSWSASAQFQATSTGAISLDQPSLGGSYTGANPMGLFVFMAPPPTSRTHPLFAAPPGGYDVTLQAKVGSRVAAAAIVRRQGYATVGVAERQLRQADGDIYGNLYLPKDTSVRRPAVLVFGADGGLERSLDASLLAAHGYPSLALAYLPMSDTRRALANIPLEYFAKALGLLRAQPGVDPRHVLVMGDDRGGEAALLLGAHFPELVNGVIAGDPSSVVYPGFPDTSRPAWTLRGRPLPALSPADIKLPDSSNNARAVIPVERIRGPILLACGGQDPLLRSCAHANHITTRLHSRGFAYPVTALRYPDAGHLAGNLTAYYSFTDAFNSLYGGTLSGTQAALADGHAKLLALLATQ
jgi:pimeloyl-ACP methyl ester carboxylesterase